MHSLARANYGQLCFLACLVLGAEVVGSFPFYFAPGWANGWPGGLTIYRVWSSWLTVTFFIMLMTIGFGAAHSSASSLAHFPEGDDTRGPYW